jgi:hypothetical protein
MRNAFFALPAIAFGMFPVGFFWIGIALLAVGIATWVFPLFHRRRRRVDPSVDETATGVVSKGEEAVLDLLLAALPRAGARWVRVAPSHPRVVRAGTTRGADVTGDEIEVVLEPVSPAATRVRLVSRPVLRVAGAGASLSRTIVAQLSRDIGIEPSATA